MKQYLVGGFTIFHTPGQFLPFKALAVLKGDEVMNLETLATVEAILLKEHNANGKNAVAKAIQITSFQPYETPFVPEAINSAAAPHLNECSVVMPPVDSLLLIEIAPGVLVRATRPAHAPSRDDYLQFNIEGNTDGWYTGRPKWTHP